MAAMLSVPQVDRVGWGILGCGSIATHAIAPAIRWSCNGTLVAAASRHAAMAGEKARALGAIRAHASYEALLADPEVTAVYIATPTGLHVEWCVRAAQAGKHVLCEKSLALSAASARAERAAAEKSGVRLVEAFMYRHHPQWSAVRRLLDDGAVGRIRFLRATLSGHIPDGDHRWSARLGGGALYDVVCYAVDVTRFVMRTEPLAVSAIADLSTPDHVDARTGATLELPNGVVAQASGSLRSVADQGVTILGSEGRIDVVCPFVPGWQPTTIVLHGRDGRRIVEVGGANHFLHQIEHFARLVLDPSARAYPAEDGVANAIVLEAIARSCRMGERIAILAPP
jgi:predicted dehydrogenase